MLLIIGSPPRRSELLTPSYRRVAISAPSESNGGWSTTSRHATKKRESSSSSNTTTYDAWQVAPFARGVRDKKREVLSLFTSDPIRGSDPTMWIPDHDPPDDPSLKLCPNNHSNGRHTADDVDWRPSPAPASPPRAWPASHHGSRIAIRAVDRVVPEPPPPPVIVTRRNAGPPSVPSP